MSNHQFNVGDPVRIIGFDINRIGGTTNLYVEAWRAINSYIGYEGIITTAFKHNGRNYYYVTASNGEVAWEDTDLEPIAGLTGRRALYKLGDNVCLKDDPDSRVRTVAHVENADDTIMYTLTHNIGLRYTEEDLAPQPYTLF